MLRSRFVRRIAPVALVIGFAISVPARAAAFGSRFDSTWAQLLDLISARAIGGFFDFGGDTAGAAGAATGRLGGLFLNASAAMDPNGRPLPSAGTGGGTADGTSSAGD